MQCIFELGVYSRAVFNNIFVCICGVHSRAAFNRVNTSNQGIAVTVKVKLSTKFDMRMNSFYAIIETDIKFENILLNGNKHYIT